MSTESAQPSSSPSLPSSRVRASDAEREQCATAVREAVGEGRLTLDEGDERLATIYAARYRDELRPLLSDLPRDEQTRRRGPHGGPPWAEYRREVHDRGEHGPWAWGDPRRRFLRHVTFVAFIAVVLTTIWAATGSQFFWPAIPLAFLAIGLIRHGMWMRWYARRR
jgi:hypothetical protein